MMIPLLAVMLAVANTPSAKPRIVEVVGLDYAFQVPSGIVSGPTTFRFVNKGKVFHEMNIALLREGVTVQQFMTGISHKVPADSFVEVSIGVLFAGPGGSASGGLATNLIAGREYSVRCIFQDSANAPRHQAMGMYSAIRPVAGDMAKAPEQRADTVVAMDYSFQYPRSLAAGHHFMALANTGKQRHELLMYRLKPGVSLQQVIDVENGGGDTLPFIDDYLGVLIARTGKRAGGMLDVDLVAGREYAIVCTFADSDSSPPHTKLGMYGSIRIPLPTRKK